MNIDSWLSIDDKVKPRTMRIWISRAKNLFRDVPIAVHKKVREIDMLYCDGCGAMPDVAYGSDWPTGDMECLKCFKNNHSADEFLV